jgi:hypothetical protein
MYESRRTIVGLQIQFIDANTRRLIEAPVGTAGLRYELREQDNAWFGPEVNVAPVKELPVILRVEFQVVGTPDVVVARLATAYRGRTFPKPAPLAQPEAIAGGQVPNANPLPRQVRAELRVRVVYRDTDRRGNPIGPELIATSQCLLFTGAVADNPTELRVLVPELVTLLEQRASQKLAVSRARGGVPTLRLLAPATLVAADDPIRPWLERSAAALSKAVQVALAVAPTRTETGQGEEEWVFPLTIRLSPAEKTALNDLDAELMIPCEAVLDGTYARRWLLRLELAQRIHPGWVVIDFGTTNSTVTLHDTLNTIPFLGLPEEQEWHLRKSLATWFSQEAQEALAPFGQRFEMEWKRWRAQLARALDAADLAPWLSTDQGPRLYQVLAELEAILRFSAEPFRRAVQVQVDRMVSAALGVPTLRRYQLFPLKIDLNRKQEVLASDIEILDVTVRKQGDEEDVWPAIRMGSEAAQGRLAAIGKDDGLSLEQILQRFPPSPKRYFGTDRDPFTVQIEGRPPVSVSYDQLMRAGWGKLLELARRAADEGGFSEGPLRRAIITYPTVAPPSVRQTIQRLLRNLKIVDVQTDYDEAVASAIFYIMREYRTYPELGLESFKARSRAKGKDGNPIQNVLVFDIGGGTTDVALLSLTLSEEAVFAAGEDRGAGGRYYKLTPKLLRATGHMQLGGELMTLRLFQLLKAMIADRLLTLVQDKKLTCDPIQSILNSALPELAVNKDTKLYRPGWLREVIERENPDARDTGRLADALHLAERVVPTRWGEGDDNRAARLQTFYGLWELAELAKKKLGGKDPNLDDDTPRDPFRIKGEQITELLVPHYDHLTPDISGALDVRLTQPQVEAAIEKVVTEAVQIALDTIKSLPKGQTVDWLILSGQSCNLLLVDRVIRDKFQESEKFLWNPECVTFLPQYAKLSTSIGACFAENLRRYRIPPAASKKNLRRGLNSLYFDVNNLFSYLPCSILQQMDNGARPTLFKAGTPLLDLFGHDNETEKRALARSPEWKQPPLTHAFYRRDYEGGSETAWSTFDGRKLAVDVGLTPAQWHDQIRVKVEIDHRLNIEMLIFRTDANHPSPDHALNGRESAPLDVSAALNKAIERHRQRAEQPQQQGDPAPVTVLPALFDAAGRLGWRIGVGDRSQVHQWLFEVGQELDTVFHRASGQDQPLRACLSRGCVESISEEGSMFVWATRPNASEQVLLGKIERPGDRPTFQRHYRFSLDERGHLRAHPGEPGFWEEQDDPLCLIREPGRVLRRKTVPAKRETDEDRNPFTGRH